MSNLHVDLPRPKKCWIDRNRLVQLLQEVPANARLACNMRGNLVWMTDKLTGYVDFEEELVEAIPDHGEL
jgi:hypothetical protein